MEETTLGGQAKEGGAESKVDKRILGLPSAHSQALMKAKGEKEARLNEGVTEAKPGQPETWAQSKDGHQLSSWGNLICKQCSTKHSGCAAFDDHLNGQKHKYAMMKIEARERQLTR